MKKLILIALLFSATMGFAQSASELFDRANEAYKNGQYQEAIDLYQNIDSTELRSADVYYNLGNSYYKLNMVAPSIYNYEKALLLDPLNEDASINLEYANKLALDAIEMLPKSMFQKFSEGVIYKLTFDSWSILAVTLSFLGALFFLLYHFSYASGKKLLFFNSSLLCGILLVVAVVFAFKSYDFEENTRMAIVFEKTAAIKNAPTLNSDTVFQLHEGTKVEVLDAIDNWKKIKLSDGKIGWIISDYIKEM
jgi:tetratricopeptide (TPR) repeat protein